MENLTSNITKALIQHNGEAMADYLNSKKGPTSLSDFFNTHRQLADSYIGQFDKANDAKKNLQEKYKKVFKSKHPSKKRNPGVELNFEEAWLNAKGKREAEIEKSRIANALLKVSAKKAISLVKSSSTHPNYSQSALTQTAPTQSARAEPAPTQSCRV